ncbi:hypothetical protein V5O39_07455 [Pseudomonas parakoreensis]
MLGFFVSAVGSETTSPGMPGWFSEYIQRESTSFAAWAFNRSLRLRSQLKNA